MHINTRGIKVVTIDKVDLIKTLNDNRSIHQNNYLRAVEGYKKDATKKFKTLMKSISSSEAGECPDLTFHLAVPENHLKDYDRVIQMLKMSIEKTADLSEEDFDQYVRDEWTWSHSFATNTMSYTGSR